jgi:hypothetical protein
MGLAEGSNFCTTGAEASLGRLPRAAATFWLTSTAAWSTFTPCWNWTKTRLNPSVEELPMVSTPLRVERASSRGLETCSATSSGPAPG